MRVLFCETSDDGTIGGSHTCMYNLVRHVDRSRVDFTVAFYRENAFVERYRSLGVPVKILPFREAVREGHPLLRKARNWYQLEYRPARYLAHYLASEGFDIVLLNNSIFKSLLFVRVCALVGVPLVSYERGFAPHGRREARASASVACSIAISDVVLEHLRRHGFRSHRIERIYDGVETDGFSPTRPEATIRQELGIPLDARVVGIVGNIKPWKGQKQFVEAFVALAREYPDLYALVIGDCAPAAAGFLASLRDMVRAAGLQERVLFLGYRPDVGDLLHVLDVFVHASTKPEPFGMVILEAMAAARPVIATNHGGPVEILEAGACGLLVPPGDGSAIAAACRRYLKEEGFAAKMGARASARVGESFRMADTARAVSDLLVSVWEDNTRRCAGGRKAVIPREVNA